MKTLVPKTELFKFSLLGKPTSDSFVKQIHDKSDFTSLKKQYLSSKITRKAQ